MIYQIRKRTEEPDDMAYSLYLCSLGLSLGSTYKAISGFIKRSHSAIRELDTRIQASAEIQNNANDKIVDKQTGSEWNFEGMAVNGQLKGRHLIRLPFDEGFWFEWIAFHP